jgi:peptidoglycan-associated lipoprotein
MKKNAIRFAFTAVTFAALAACHSDIPPQPPTDGGNTNIGAGTGGPTGPVTMTNPDSTNVPSFNKSVFFDYNSFVVKDDQRGVVTQNASYIKANNRHVIIQGNTDERGGSEFNLALGQKRAEAVRKQMSLLGVPDSSMEAVSFGKEKPLATGHDEASWAQNRRVDIAY